MDTEKKSTKKEVAASNAVPAMDTPSPAQPATAKRKRSKKPFIIGGAIALALVIIGGGATAYALYQNPDKVVGDGMAHILSTQPHSGNVNFTFKNDAATVDMALDFKSNEKIANGTLTVGADIKDSGLNLKGSADFAGEANGTGYLKLNDVDKLADKAINELMKAQAKQYTTYGMTMNDRQIEQQKNILLKRLQPIIDKINNKWIKFSPDTTDSKTSKQQKCYADALKEFQNNKDFRNEIKQAYVDNNFMVVKKQLGVKDGSYGFEIELDSDKAKSFGDAVKKTKIADKLKSCDTSNNSSSNDSNNDKSDNTKVTLWVSQWSHNITGMDITADDDDTSGTFKATFDYSAVGELSVPRDAVDSKQLEKEFKELSTSSTKSY